VSDDDDDLEAEMRVKAAPKHLNVNVATSEMSSPDEHYILDDLAGFERRHRAAKEMFAGGGMEPVPDYPPDDPPAA